MPKLKPSPLEEKRRIVRSCMAKYQALYAVSDADLAKAMHVTVKTVQNRRRNPEMFRLEELWGLVKILRIPDEELKYFFP